MTFEVESMERHICNEIFGTVNLYNSIQLLWYFFLYNQKSSRISKNYDALKDGTKSHDKKYVMKWHLLFHSTLWSIAVHSRKAGSIMLLEMHSVPSTFLNWTYEWDQMIIIALIIIIVDNSTVFKDRMTNLPNLTNVPQHSADGKCTEIKGTWNKRTGLKQDYFFLKKGIFSKIIFIFFQDEAPLGLHKTNKRKEIK